MSHVAVIIFPHQLFEDVKKLPKDTLILFVEDDLYFTQLTFHKQKLILHRATMKQYADELEAAGYSVVYIETGTRPSMQNLEATLRKHSIAKVKYFELSDDWLQQRLQKVLADLHIEIRRYESPAFLTSLGQAEEYFKTHPNRMQQFYEWQRKRLDILIDDGKPAGGKWSYDEANRKKLPEDVSLPKHYSSKKTSVIQEAITWANRAFADNPGTAETFAYPVSHADARAQLHEFLEDRFALFGPYEDAIARDESQLFHSVLSPLLNIGLLTPQHVVDETLRYANKHTIAIESVEGFIRQIIGWREYMRATYIHYGREMRTTNHMNFTSTLDSAWWSGTVGLEPVDATIKRILDTAYAHHIERLMVLGNAMLLLRINPDDVYEWFMGMFIDAYDWVMVPNVYAMSQFAAGEKITTKPYVSGSNYIIKMSDYKKDDWAEQWDALYWQFIADNRSVFEKNYRSSMMVKLYDRQDETKKRHHSAIAKQWLSKP